ncbi:MAG: cobyrinate a,c-diamide synthase [Gammaproteobacteria bacterium]|nr:cobyrinate a,c-diamide synthase [Gammaproteobacteria bacterium]MBU1655024.1 cobyrinate a,c-diamide synthase [Gammaproteobacteria bacterium]MBU1960330.1 cobyrinate a,c-diamide synthase [Gammaproteobacteria bacterium]
MGYFYISAAHKSSGKTTLSIGLCAALAARGLRVQPFKKGPDYIDPLWLSRAAGRPCFNLDFNSQSNDEILDLFRGRSSGADVTLIEGNKGLYDGMALDGSDCNAAMAKLLGAPVVLILDTKGVTRGIAPLLMGYQSFDPGVKIAGVILNQLAGPRQEGKIRQVIEHYTDIPILGAVQRDPNLVIEERHLGLVPSNEAGEVEEKIACLRQAVEAGVDLDALLRIAKPFGAAQDRPFGPVSGDPRGEVFPTPRVRIGVARDAAFGFYYPDDLDGLRRAGAELVFFSPIADRGLPPVDGLFLGGGFPETQMEALEANHPMREAIKGFIEAGGPAYAECGGMMYLSRTLRWQGRITRMAGVIPADAVMHERPQGRGYVRLREGPDHPWGGGKGSEYPVHEFHYSRLENLSGPLRYAFDLVRGVGIDGSHDGIVHKNLLAGYGHHRQVNNNPWTQRFVDFVEGCKNQSRH